LFYDLGKTFLAKVRFRCPRCDFISSSSAVVRDARARWKKPSDKETEEMLKLIYDKMSKLQ
jgi:hypothetical protein